MSAAGQLSPTMLSLTAIRVSDLDRATEFYVDGCGFTVDKNLETPAFRAVIVRAGGAGLELPLPTESVTPLDHGNGLVKVVVNTDDAAARIASACAHGGTPEMAATVLEAYGMVIGTIRDPDGYLVEFVQRNGVNET